MAKDAAPENSVHTVNEDGVWSERVRQQAKQMELDRERGAIYMTQRRARRAVPLRTTTERMPRPPRRASLKTAACLSADRRYI